MNPDVTTEECLQMLDDIKSTIQMLNNSVKEYNQKRDELAEQIKANSQMKASIDMILVNQLDTLTLEDLHLQVNDYEIIEDDTNSEKDEYDKYDEIGDFEMNSGSNARCLKGTGKNKIDKVYNSKHVRVSLGKSGK